MDVHRTAKGGAVRCFGSVRTSLPTFCTKRSTIDIIGRRSFVKIKHDDNRKVCLCWDLSLEMVYHLLHSFFFSTNPVMLLTWFLIYPAYSNAPVKTEPAIEAGDDPVLLATGNHNLFGDDNCWAPWTVAEETGENGEEIMTAMYPYFLDCCLRGRGLATTCWGKGTYFQTFYLL